MSLVLDEHRHYLADRPRLDAFRRALAAVVRPGDVVLDLASGTGILGFLACEAGASHVYAIDDGPIIALARQFAHANGYADRVTFIREVSTRVTLPQRVDVVVCDQIGNLGIEAGVFEYLLDARARLAKPDARFVPSRLTFMAAPLESEDLRGRLAFWSTRPEGLDVTAGRGIAPNTGYPELVNPSQLLGPPAPVASAALPPAGLGPIRGEAVLTCTRAGVLDGICAWFVAELAPGVEMTNAPSHASRIDRRQVMLPVEQPVKVAAGDSVAIRVSFLPADSLVNWDVSVTSPRGAAQPVSFRHSTFKGMLLSDEDLSRTNPQWQPTLTPAGHARRSVLELCDGRRPLRDIEAEVLARHPEVLGSPTDAATFVAEVVTRYCFPDAPVPDRKPVDR